VKGIKFIKEVNESKKETVKFSPDTTQWHGDQYLSLLRNADFLNAMGECVKTDERENFMKLCVILSIIKHFSPKDVLKLKIREKLRSLHIFEMNAEYTKFVKKRITSHQILHLLDISLYLGYLGNYDGQGHEKMHKRVARK
jgi:hypothetical protein